MGTSRTTLKKGDNLPARGRSQKNLILDAIKEAAVLASVYPDNANDKEVREITERNFWQLVATRAVDKDDPASSTLMKTMLDKGWSNVKPAMNTIEFDFNKDDTDTDKAKSILYAIAGGDIPPDVGTMLLASLKDLSMIEANTELKERIEAIEKSLGLANG